ncbi:MAG: hypothetical protein Q7U54_17645 [Bacteroidales bacterium]|nr:hypothetical protein [Bacteroidales bacterium]
MGSTFMLLVLYLLKFEPDVVMVFLIFWLIYTIPAVYLYLEYLYVNLGVYIKFNTEGFIYYKNGIEQNINKDQIETITYYLTPNAYKGSGFQYLAIEGFRFVRIVTKTSQQILITNLMSSQLEEDISSLGIPIRRKKRLFCTTRI